MKVGKSGERGQVLVLTVLAMAVLLGMVAMAVDVGLFFHHRRDLQNAADAAALAGAVELPDNPTLAIQRAQEWAKNNGIDLTTEIASIDVQTTNVANDTMHVAVTRDFGFIFARVLGLNQADVVADASGIIGSPVGLAGLTPWAVTDDVFQGLKPGDDATLKYDANDVLNGNFQPIALDGTGAAVYRATVQNGSDSDYCSQGQEQPGCPSLVSTEPGNLIGPTRQAVQWLQQNTANNCDAFNEVFTPDPNNPGEYLLTPSCNPFSNPAAATLVSILPVISDLCNGSCDVTILRFAMFFIEGIQCSGQGQGSSCTVTGKYVKAAVDVNAVIGPYDPAGSLATVRLIE